MYKAWGYQCLAVFCLVLLAPCFLPGSSSMAGQMSVLTPKTACRVLARDPGYFMVLRLDDAKDLGALKVEGKEGLLSPLGTWKKGQRAYPHFRLALKPGKNVFEIMPWEQEINIDYKPIRSVLNIRFDDPKLFTFHSMGKDPAECAQCHTKKVPEDVYIPKELYGPFDPRCVSCHKELVQGSTWTHGPAENWLCLYCHGMADGNDKVAIFKGKPVDLCLRCHVTGRKWVKMAHVHGPVGTGDCTACHNPHGNRFRFQLWAKGKGPLCVACHVDKSKYLEPSSSFFIHGIITGYGCVACHSPHATSYRFQLYKPINELCTGCHTGLKGITRGHPVGGHPLKGPADPRRKGRKFSCTSCHNPHGSDYKFLLIGDILGGHICTKCHY